MSYGPPQPGRPVPGPRPHPAPLPGVPLPAPPVPSPPPSPVPRARSLAVHPLDAAVLGAGVLVVVFSFFDYYTYAPKGRLRTACSQPGAPKIARVLCHGASEGAWSGLFGWLAVVVVATGTGAAAVATLAPHVRLPAPGRLVAVAAFGLGVVGTLLALFFVPNYTVHGVVAHGSHYGKSVTEGHGFSYWVIVGLQLAGLVLALVRYQQTGAGADRLSGSGADSPPRPAPPAPPPPGAWPAPPPA